MDNQDFYKELITRYREKKATKEEIALFFQLLHEGKIEHLLADDMDEQLNETLHVKTAYIARKTKIRQLFKYAAAIVLCVTGLTLYFYIPQWDSSNGDLLIGKLTHDDVKAGSNKAILKLADGREIELEHSSSGKLKTEEGIISNKPVEGMLVYKAKTTLNKSDDERVKFHELSIPLGGQYQVVLPDQSKVWLNAGSRLRFPTSFSTGNREIYLEGEAYFEVKSAREPFIVSTAHQRVQVLGTTFNVKAYADEAHTITTLLSGSVKVNTPYTDLKEILIKPNEQAICDHSTAQLKIAQVDAKDFAAWKDGFFVFQDATMEDAMQEIARWYNVEIAIDTMPRRHLYAVLPKEVNLSELLEMIDMTSNTKFRIEGRRICL